MSVLWHRTQCIIKIELLTLRWEDAMKLNFKKQFSTLALVTGFAATASMSLAGECRVAEASMDKPGGFPDRALTMIVPYGPGGGSGQVAATKYLSLLFS